MRVKMSRTLKEIVGEDRCRERCTACGIYQCAEKEPHGVGVAVQDNGMFRIRLDHLCVLCPTVRPIYRTPGGAR